MATPKSSSAWVGSAEVLVKLKIHRNHLLNLRKRGIFREKTHYRNISPGAERPTYRYHLKRCRERLYGKEN